LKGGGHVQPLTGGTEHLQAFTTREGLQRVEFLGRGAEPWGRKTKGVGGGLKILWQRRSQMEQLFRHYRNFKGGYAGMLVRGGQSQDKENQRLRIGGCQHRAKKLWIGIQGSESRTNRVLLAFEAKQKRTKTRIGRH